MPLYTYTCTVCVAQTDIRATVAEKSAGLSPVYAHCGATDLRQQFHATGLIGTAPTPSTPRAGGGCGPVGCGPSC